MRQSKSKSNRTPQWVKKLGGHAGELYVAAELSRRSIANALLPENFSEYDIMAGNKDGDRVCFIQVKSCHPDRSSSFILSYKEEAWATDTSGNRFVVFVWLGSPAKNEPPRYWIATRQEVGQACIDHYTHGDPNNWERRFWVNPPKTSTWRKNATLNPVWENRWSLIERYLLD